MPDPQALARDAVIVICEPGEMARARRLWLAEGYEEVAGLPTDTFALTRAFKGLGNADPKIDDYDQRVLMFMTKTGADAPAEPATDD